MNNQSNHMSVPSITYLYYPSTLAPVLHRHKLSAAIPCPYLSWFDGPRGSRHPDPDFEIVSTRRGQQRVEPVNQP